MSATQYVEDRLIRHQIDLLRYSNTTARELKALLRQLAKSVNKQLASARTEDQLARFGRMQLEVNRLVAEMDTAAVIHGAVDDVATVEPKFIHTLYDSATSVNVVPIPKALVVSASNRIPTTLISGRKEVNKTIDQLIRDYDVDASRQILTTLQTGIIEGKPTKTIAREINRVTTNQLYRNAEALSRTVVNHVGNVARSEFYKANDAVITKERYVATLDSRTTFICASLDSELFPVGVGPIPPLHYSCRSLRVGVIDPRFGLPELEGQRPQVGADGPGTTSSKTTFNSFFGRQPASWQEDYLGPGRFELYKKGQLNIDAFTDDRGRVLTINEVAARNGLNIE